MTKEGIVSQSVSEAAARPDLAPWRTLCALASVFLVVTLIHAVETGKFVASWSRLP